MTKVSLRTRPSNIRFFVLGVSDTDISVASAHKSLELSVDKGAHTLYIADLKTNKITCETDPRKFLDWWAEHYQDTDAIYK